MGWHKVHERSATGLAVLAAAALASCEGADTPRRPAQQTAAVTMTAVGRTEGRHAVGHDGQLRYSIPIDVPPGRAGLEPDLSLEYSSSSGLGPLGYGWQLGGLPKITRCPRTQAQDGKTAGIKLTWTDRLCLDGDRLVAVNGQYGVERTEYRTEHESFRKILAENGGFVVYEKGGRVLTFGAQARVGGGADLATLAWYVSQIEDPLGNRIIYEYLADTGELLPSRISYGRNILSPGDSKTPAKFADTYTRFVSFEYEDVPNLRGGYVAGRKYHLDHRLRFIRTQGPAVAGGSPVPLRSYELRYNGMLTAVQECEGAGVCKPFTQLTYLSPEDGFQDMQQPVRLLPSSTLGEEEQWLWMLHTGDINGDGYDDILYRRPLQDASGWFGRWYYRLSTGAGLGPETTADELPDQRYVQAGSGISGQLIDLNLDGKADFAIWVYGPGAQKGRHYIFYSNGQRFIAEMPDAESEGNFTGTPSDDFQPILYVGDFEGRGYPSLMRLFYDPDGTAHWHFRPNFDGVLQVYHALRSAQQPGGLLSLEGTASYLADLNGDGILQLVHQFGSTEYGFAAEQIVPPNTTTQTSNLQMPTILTEDPADVRRLFTDVNGDGIDDLVLYQADGGPVNLSINDGRQLPWVPRDFETGEPKYAVGASRVDGIGIDPGVRVIDYNGDGANELLLLGRDNGGGRNAVTVDFFSRFGDSMHPYEMDVPIGRSVGSMGYKLAKTLDIDGNGLTDFVQLVGTDLHIYQRRGAVQHSVLTRVVDGLGQRLDFSYRRLTDSTVYRPGGLCPAGTVCLRRGRPVVASETIGANGPTSHTLTHSYEDGRIDLGGRGFLGFARHVVNDPARGAYTTYELANDSRAVLTAGATQTTIYRALGQPRVITTVVKLAAGNHVIERKIDYDLHTTAGSSDGGVAYYEFASALHDSERDPYGNAVTSDTTFEVDDFGNSTRVLRLSDRHSDLATATYDNSNTARWLIGEPTLITLYSKGTDGSEARRVQRIEWDTLGRGLPVKLTRQPDATDSTYAVTDLEIDGTGVLTRVATSDRQGNVRKTSFKYEDPDHVFPTKVLNALGHTTQLTFHPSFGVVTRSVDPNNVATGSQYDGFGRLIYVDAPDSGDTTISYQASSSGAFAVSSARWQNGTTITHYDAFARPTLVQETGFDGRWVNQTTTYDALGRVAAASQPGFEGEAVLASSFVYDGLDRLLRLTRYDGAVVRFEPSLVRPCTIDARGHRSCQTVDDLGEVLTSIDYDDLGGQHTTSFSYGPFSQRRRMVDERGNATVQDYDEIGRRIYFKDPDAAGYRFAYNGVDELVGTTDGLGRSTTITPDALGRATTVASPDGTLINKWDTAPSGIGQLASSRSASDVTTLYGYDLLGRVRSLTQLAGQVLLDTRFGYDSVGRLSSVSYPAVGTTTLSASYTYNAAGYLTLVAVPSTSVSWRVNARNAAGAPTSESYGNGAIVSTRGYLRGTGPLNSITSSNAFGVRLQQLSYGYDGNQNVTARWDGVDGTIEAFTYDYLDRLATWTTYTSNATRAMGFDYDVLGNLLAMRVTAGWGSPMSMTPASAAAGPHRLASSSLGSYAYDDNGNQTSGPGRTIGYTAFDLPASITAGGKTWSFGYTADQTRAFKDDGAGTRTTYLDRLYERRATPSGASHVLTLQGERGPVAQLVLKVGASGGALVSEVSYLLDDHLGSVEASADVAGNPQGRNRFTPFGRRTSSTTPAVHAGFTGHEQDDEFGLVNMRGRLYDPAIGRFLSRDPIIQDAEFSQALNPYSYVLNNPLTMSDPSGFCGGTEEAPCGDPPDTGGADVVLSGGGGGGGAGAGVTAGSGGVGSQGFYHPPATAAPAAPAQVFGGRFDDNGAAAGHHESAEVFDYGKAWQAFKYGLRDGALLGLNVAFIGASGGAQLVRFGWTAFRGLSITAFPGLAGGASALAAGARDGWNNFVRGAGSLSMKGGAYKPPRQRFLPGTQQRLEAGAPKSSAGGPICPGCGKDISKPITIKRKDGTETTRIGFDVDHIIKTWAERRDKAVAAGITTKSYYRWLYNVGLRPLCPACNQSHKLEGKPAPYTQVWPPNEVLPR